MAISYNWKITSMKVVDHSNGQQAVVQTYWEKTGTDRDGVTGVFSGATPFEEVNTEDITFIPLEQLTQNIMIGWIKLAVMGETEQHIDEQIQLDIDRKSNFHKSVKLPWS